jgi:hypothetical protein
MSSKRQAWLEALRSGDYQQGKGALKRISEYGYEVTHCCMGVACEVIAPERFSEKPCIGGKYPFTGPVYDYQYERMVKTELYGSPSDDIQQLLGISENDVSDLIHLNDAEGRDFKFIADYIETLPER